jgi:hypothetical protein
MASTWWSSNQPPPGGLQATGDPNPNAPPQTGDPRVALGPPPQTGGGLQAGGGVQALPGSMSQQQGAAPAYYNAQDPTHQAVMNAFQQKGIQPRDAADFNYWVDHINQSGGLEKGYANEGGTGTWIDRMASGSGGVGDYGQGGGGGQMTMGGGMGMSDAERSAYGVPSGGYKSNPYGGGWDSPEVPAWLKDPYHLPTQQELESTPGYQARQAMGQQGRERSAAARGSILNGGTQKALERYGQDYASNEYSNLVGQQLGARQQNQQEYQQNQVQPGQYKQTNQYRQYLDEQGRTLNDYLTNYNINRTGVQDFLNQQNRTADRGLTALSYGRR